MKPIRVIAFILVASSAFAGKNDPCSTGQLTNTLKVSKKICLEHLKEFADRSSATCVLSKTELKNCSASCKDENGLALAKVQVNLNADCGREVAYFSKTVIKYYR